jgi:ubiquinone biosynthesis monooxygenase Coq7
MSHLNHKPLGSVNSLSEGGAVPRPDSMTAAPAAAGPCPDGALVGVGAIAQPARDAQAPDCVEQLTGAKTANAVVWPSFNAMPLWLRQELRSDHAGEYGAVMIYRGILALSKDGAVRQFAERHLVTERQHLSLMEEIVPHSGRTKLIPLWRVMGWLTGALPALVGPRAVFATIEAVEHFVDHHYQQQIDRLEAQGDYGVLRQILVDCQADEVSHREEAAQLASPRRSWFLRSWCAVVGSGSALAVLAARRV